MPGVFHFSVELSCYSLHGPLELWHWAAKHAELHSYLSPSYGAS